MAASLLFSGLAGSALAQTTLPTVRIEAATALVAPGGMGGAFQSATSPAAGARDPQVAELARSLNYDIDQIFEHVRDQVRLTPVYGLQKGARGVALDGYGTAFDQAQFLVDALREADAVAQRGYSPKYVRGQITLSAAQFGDWFGVTDADAARKVLADGGIPATVTGSGGSFSVAMSHVWVSATIGGVSYVFDPSYKPHVRTPGVNVAEKMLYDGPALLAAGGGTGPDTSVTGFDRPTFRSKLQNFRQNLETYLSNPANGKVGAKLDEVVGHSSIVPHATSENRRTSLPYAGAPEDTWAGQIPDVFRTRLTVQVSTWAGSSTFFADEIYAKPIRLGYSTGASFPGGTFPPDLALSGASAGANCAQFIDNGTPGAISVSVAVDHPYPGSNYADRTVNKTLSWRQCTGGQFILTADFGDMTPQAAALMRQATEPFKYDPARSREMIVGPMLAGVAQQYSEYLRLSGEVLKSTYQLHDIIGIHQIDHVDTELSSTIGSQNLTVNTPQEMVTMHFEAAVSVNANSAVAPPRAGLTQLARGGLAIAESGAARQEADADRDVTALTLLTGQDTLAQTPGTYPSYLADSGNWATVRSQLQNYPAPALTTLDGYVAAGYLVFVPQQGALNQKNFSYVEPQSGAVRVTRLMETAAYLNPGGPQLQARVLSRAAFIAFKPSTGEGAYLVYDPRRRDLTKGGINVSVVDKNQAILRRPDAPTAGTTNAVRAGLKVDPQSGKLGYSPGVDISDGVGEFPHTLTLERRYDASDQSNSGFGVGWKHNWQHDVSLNNDGAAALGNAGAFGAASALVQIVASADLAASPTAKKILAAANVEQWFVDQTMNNVAVVNAGLGAPQQFFRTADGTTFVASDPDGARLVQSGQPMDSLINRRLYQNVSFAFTSKDGDTRAYPFFRRSAPSANELWEPIITQNLTLKTFPMGTWRFPTGVKVSTTYDLAGLVDQHFVLTGVSNNLGSKLERTVYTPGDLIGASACHQNQYTSNPVMGRVTFRNSSTSEATYTLYPEIGVEPTCEPPSEPGDHTIRTYYRPVLMSFADQSAVTWRYGYNVYASTYGAGLQQLNAIWRPTAPEAQPTISIVAGLDGRVRLVRDAYGAEWEHYTAPGRYTMRGPPLPDGSRPISLTLFDEYGRPNRSIDPFGATTVTAYDYRDRPIRITRPEGNSETSEYDIRSNLVRTCEIPKSRAGQACRADLGDITASAVIPYPDLVTCPESDPVLCNKPQQVTGAMGAVTHFTWNAYGALASALGTPDNHGVAPLTEFQFTPHTVGADTVALLTSKTEKISATQSVVTAYHYDATNKWTPDIMTVDPGGLALTSKFIFDTVGNLRTIDGPRPGTGDTVTMEWSPSRRLTQITEPDPDGAGLAKPTSSLFTYNTAGDLAFSDRGTPGATFTVLSRTGFAYDVLGRKNRETVYDVETGLAASMSDVTYDPEDRVLCAAIRMDLATAGAPGDACTQRSGKAGSADRITRNVYDLAGRLCRVEKALLVAAARNLAVTTPNCPTLSYPSLAMEEYAYSSNGQRTEVIDGNGNKTTLVYDGFDRLESQRFPDLQRGARTSSTSDVESYGYDKAGNRTRLTKRSGAVITYQFDALNRLVLKDLPAGVAKDVYYDYDLLGRMTSARFDGTTGDGTVLEYDKAGRLRTDTTLGRQLATGYDEAGARAWLTLSDGFSIAYDRDTAGRLQTVRDISGGNPGLQLAAFTYDGLGRRKELTQGNGFKAVYDYDGAGRLDLLEHVADPAATHFKQTLKFNPASQLTEQTQADSNFVWKGRPPASPDRTFDGLNRDQNIAVIAGGGYDTNGNLKNDGVRKFTYDVENRLVKVEPTGSSGPVLDLTYDPLGRIVSTSAAPNPGAGATGTGFFYDGNRLVGEYGSNGAPLRHYVHGDGLDEPLVWYQGSTPRWLHADRQGSVVAWSGTQPVGGTAPVTSYTFGPWGEPSQWESRFAYTGQIALPEAQLYHYKGRVYDPLMGRFLQTDPIGQKDDLNLYAYVGNDPMNNSDPNGTRRICTLGAIKFRSCVWVDGNGDGHVTDNDLTDEQHDALATDYHDFIVRNNNRNIQYAGKNVFVSKNKGGFDKNEDTEADKSSEGDMTRAISQFAGAAALAEGGKFAQQWKDTKGIVRFVNIAGNLTPASNPDGYIRLYQSAEKFDHLPSNLGRLILHEAGHTGVNPVSGAMSEQSIDRNARNILMKYGLGGGRCVALNNFAGC